MRAKGLFLAAVMVALFVACGGEDNETPAVAKGIWVNDLLGGAVWKFTFDGRTLVHNDSLIGGGSGGIAVNRTTGCCWVACPSVGEVVKLSPAGERIFTVNLPSASGGVNAIAVEESDGSVRCANSGMFWVLKLNDAGEELWRVDVFVPEDLSVYETDGACWVAHFFDHTNNAGLTKLDKDGNVLFTRDPGGDAGSYGVAVDQRNGDCWVVGTDGKLYKYTAAGDVKFEVSTGLYIRDLAIFPGDGSVVLLTSDTVANLSYLTKFDANGNDLWTAGVSYDASYVAVNPNDNTIWVSHDEKGLVKYSPTGQELLTVKPTDSFYPDRLSVHY